MSKKVGKIYVETCDGSNVLEGIWCQFIDSLREVPSSQEKCRGHLVKGSPNTEGTCFLNAVLQNLLALDVLRHYFLESVDDSFGPLNASMKKLFSETSVESGTAATIDATPLFRMMCDKFPFYYGPDLGGSCTHFVADLVEVLSREELKTRKLHGREATSTVSTMFRIKINKKTLMCGDQTRFCLQLKRPKKNSQPPSDDDDQAGASIESCLETFQRPNYSSWRKPWMIISRMSTLFGSHKTNQSEVKRDVKRINMITKAPPVLILKFHRVSIVLAIHVKFKETLDLESYMDPECIDRDGTYKYRLVGIVETPVPCHVVAYVRDGDGSWYYVNDHIVNKVPVEEVLNRKPYMFYYERC